MLLAAILLAPLSPARIEVDPKKLQELVSACETTKLDCLVVMVDGKVVVDKWFGDAKPGRIEAMSATKSVINLAVGLLIKEGKIKNIEDPVSKYFPDYKGGGKEKVTIQNILEHTSGIEARPDTADIYSSSDFVKNALEKQLTSPPGATFFYNNRAVNLLAGLVGKAANERADRYIKRKLLTRLGITDFGWSLDKAGNPHGMSGFQVRPEDFAKIGQFVLDGGDGMLPDHWITDSIQPTKLSMSTRPCGRLWWPLLENNGVGIDDALLESWKKAGMKAGQVAKYATLKGKVFPADQDLYAAMREAFKGDPDGLHESNGYFTSGKVWPYTNIASGPVHSYAAAGYLGQYLVIVPSARLVAVRMRVGRDETAQEQSERTFEKFPVLVDQLARTAK